ncbi:MAG: ABC transporter substrate-binding protein [Candidatus Paceibacterota bacterium]
MSKSKKSLIIVISIFLALCFIFFLYITFEQEFKKDEFLKIGYAGHSLNYGSVMVAYEGDFFNKHGVSTKLVSFKSGSEIGLALATGKIDVALLSISSALITIDAGAPIKIIGPTARASTVVFVRPNDSIQSFSDLRGKKIEGGGTGTSKLEFLRAASKEGLKESDFTFVDVDKDYKEIALLQKKIIDAIPTSKYNADSLIKAGAIPLKEWEEKRYDRVFNAHTYMVVNTKYAQNHEAEIEKVIDSIIDAQSFIAKDPQNAAPLVVRNIQNATDGVANFTTSQVLENWQKSIRYIVWSDPNEVIDIVNFLRASKGIKNTLTLDQIFDLHFLSKLEKMQKIIYGSEN